jgi:hypothetical protein
MILTKLKAWSTLKFGSVNFHNGFLISWRPSMAALLLESYAKLPAHFP